MLILFKNVHVLSLAPEVRVSLVLALAHLLLLLGHLPSIGVPPTGWTVRVVPACLTRRCKGVLGVLLLLWPGQLHVTRVKERVIGLDRLAHGENCIEAGWISEPLCIFLCAVALGLPFVWLWRSLLLLEEGEDTILQVNSFGTLLRLIFDHHRLAPLRILLT